MGQETEISWCDSTFNCWWGCTKVGNSDACTNCYALTWARRTGFDIWGDDKPRRYFAEKHFDELLKWDRKAQADGVFRSVFVMSMGDWAEGRPEQKPHLEILWDRFLRTKNLIFLMLTKRPQLINKLCPLRSQRLWHGATAETQRWFDLRWEHLKRVESEVYWFSIEPMMERIVLPKDFLALGKRAWVIVGGESGGHARPMNPEWARSLRDQCLEAGVPYHFKQHGEWMPVGHVSAGIPPNANPLRNVMVWDGGERQFRVGKKNAGCLLDGVEWKQFPAPLGKKACFPGAAQGSLL